MIKTCRVDLIKSFGYSVEVLVDANWAQTTYEQGDVYRSTWPRHKRGSASSTTRSGWRRSSLI
eukprot:13048740-Alexandrium_andersonii.AAC.1